MTDPARHADSRPALERLIRKVPGFKGYLEREDRRDSDQLARQQIVDVLQQGKGAIDRFQRAAVDALQLDLIPPCERLRSRIDLLQSRLKGAMRGYSGFFDFVQVTEEVLDQVYVHDLLLLEDAEKLATLTAQLTPSADASAVLENILSQTEQIGERIDQRTKILEGLA